MEKIQLTRIEAAEKTIDSIESIKWLEIADHTDDQVIFPTNLGRFINLKTLVITSEYSQYNGLETKITFPSSLETLVIFMGKLNSYVLEEIFKLTKLKVLNIQENPRIDRMVTGWGNLQRLEYLNLYGFENSSQWGEILSDLEEIAKLPNLKEISLGHDLKISHPTAEFYWQGPGTRYPLKKDLNGYPIFPESKESISIYHPCRNDGSYHGYKDDNQFF